MVRRRFLALTGRTLAAIGLAGLGTRPAKAEIGTILAIINTAASLTGLFFGGDNGAAPLQVAMLRAISAQLLEIGTGIVEILKDLTELKRLVGDIPEQTVIAMYRDDVYGLINGVYQARLEEYERGGYASHPDTLRDWAARMSRTVLEPLERDRNVLMNPKFEARSLVPIVCQACFVETQGINLVAYAPERKLAVVHAYQRWLTEVSDGSTGESITGKIRELEVAQKKNLASIKAFTPEVFECYTDVMGAAGLYRGWKFRMTTNYKIYDIYWADGQPQEAL